MRKFFGKILIIAFWGSILAGTMPISTKASIPTIETNAAVIASEVTVANIKSVKEPIEKVLLNILKRTLLNQIVNQITSYIEGNGDPKFITDWRGFLSQAADNAAGEFINSTALGFVCSPFNLQLRIALSPVKKFDDQVSCSLTQIVGNVEAFYNDFRTGGWIGYAESWAPQNNFIGVLLMSSIELEKQKAAAVSAAQSEGIAGGGFLSIKKCDENGKNCQTTTPGRVVGDLVGEAVGSDIAMIVNATELSDYVGAIADAFVNRLVREGVNGLRGVSSKPGGGVQPIGAVTQNCGGLSGTARQNCLNFIQANQNSFNTARANLLDQVNQTLVPRQTIATLINDIIALENKLINKLQELYSCRPRESTNEEIIKEQAIVNTLKAAQNENQLIIEEAQFAISDMRAVPTGDWASLSQTETKYGDKFNPTAASDLLADIQEEYDATKVLVDSRVSELNTEIAICRGIPF
ncbi:MAG: hypothetical protein AAB885_02045 [Patescibacteria group bacterium]